MQVLKDLPYRKGYGYVRNYDDDEDDDEDDDDEGLAFS